MRVHGASILPFAIAALALKQREFSRSSIHLIEAVALFGVAFGYIAMGTFLPAEGGAATVVAYIVALLYVARTIYVPSTVRHTVVLGAIIGVALVSVMYVHYLGVDPEIWKRLGYHVTSRSRETIAASQAAQHHARSTRWHGRRSQGARLRLSQANRNRRRRWVLHARRQAHV